MKQKPQYYVVAIYSYEGDDTARKSMMRKYHSKQDEYDHPDNVFKDVEKIWAIVEVKGKRATIYDDGYRSRKDAQKICDWTAAGN